MKVVILAGGLGTRISEESHLRPKPMIEIGGAPILWHIMKYYSQYGYNEFIICCGYKGYIIKEYFANYYLHRSDITFDFRKENHPNWGRKWNVEVRKKMSDSHLIKRTLFMCDLNGRKIKEFSSLTEAADYIGVSRGAIRNCVNGIIKTCKGFTWKEQN